MFRFVCTLLLATALAAGRERPRVFLMSFDALGQERLTADPAAEPLRALRRLMKTGAYAEGLMPAYPSTTANGHAALWTGTYVGRNGILYNSTPVLPRSEHAFNEKVVGFRSDALTAEPIWLTAARQGRSVVAHQATQIFPFLPQSVGDRPQPKLLVANGFQSRSFAPWRAVHADSAGVRRVSCEDAVACFEWETGPVRLRGTVVKGGMRISAASGGPAVEVRAQPEESQAPVSRPLARYWSAPLAVPGLPDETPAYVVFRLFSVAGDGSAFDLLQTPVQEMAIYSGQAADPAFARAMLAETGPVVGNTATQLWQRGELGKQAAIGGDGTAERRLLETLELTVRQQMAETRWLVKHRDPDLLITYLAAVDDMDHQWYGFDRLGNARYREFRRWGFTAVNRAAQALLGLATKNDHVVVTSDHGMAPVEWLVPVNRILQNAKLPALAYSTCVLLNTSDWKGGVVAPADREQALDTLEGALRAIRGPDGVEVVSRVYRSRDDLALFGHDGPAGADLCFDMRPGYGLSESAEGDRVQHPRSGAIGQHGFDPRRPDMQAVLLIAGPRAQGRGSLGAQRSASVAALVADLLAIEPPKDSTFASPLRQH